MTNQEKFKAMREQLNRLKEKNDQLETALSNMHERMTRKDEVHISLSALFAYVWPSGKKKKANNSAENQ